MTNIVQYFKQRQEDIANQTPEMIEQAISEIHKIQDQGNLIKDPEKRLEFYANWLFQNVKYDKERVDDFYDAKKQGGNKNCNYCYNFNNCRLFLEKKGACQQFAVGLAMLCYGDPEIECHQLVIKKNDIIKNMSYKHSATHVRLKKDGKVYKEGIVDPVNFKYYKFMCTREEYIDRCLDNSDDAYFLGMAYYVPGLELKNIFKIMQSFGLGIKFNFKDYESGKVEFMKAYDQVRLQKFINYQIGLNDTDKPATSHKKK